MSKFYFLCLGLLFAFEANAQIVNIPDTNFKTKLLSASANNNVAFIISLADYGPIDANQDGEIQVSEAMDVRTLTVTNAGITSLTGIEKFGNLLRLLCSSNSITTFDASVLPHLIAFVAANNNFTSLDFSATDVTEFNLSNNPNIFFINIKNGHKHYFGGMPPPPQLGEGIYFQNTPNLQYICADENEIFDFQEYVDDYNVNINLNSYCTFEPGGSIYTIQGNVRYDQDNIGCTELTPNAGRIKFLTNGAITSVVTSDASSSYIIPVQSGNYTIIPNLEHPEYFTVSPSSVTVDFPATTSPSINDFCIAPAGVYPDLEIVLIPVTNARPGFNAKYKIIYKNNGTQVDSGTVNLNFDSSVFDFVSASPSITTQDDYNLVWNYTDLKPFESREILVTMHLNSPNDTPAVVGGELLYYTAYISSPETDYTQNDNISTLYQTVVNSLDPNDKTCVEGKNLPPELAGTYVHYVIRFENTGTANAQNVVVKDIIDTSQFSVGTLVPLDGSHPFTTRITDTNRVEFIFENINLPFDDANNDGYVAFKIKTLPTLAAGTTFSNTASIYFDYNAPIMTNTASTILQLLGTDDFGFDNYFTIYPNPANDMLNVKSNKNINPTSFSVYNMLGQLVLAIPQLTETIDISGLKTGNYFIKINTEKGNTTTRFIKK
ncbi:DUF7619 domain-containing protein [Flavobacterium sp. 3HN19-14]|uniref:DUF7619 domain-containing protein n=1 Tax=Flavobacterium sp. 3HN19-14 TaxID=3448133 RepID=UPI003EDF2E87